MKTTLYKRDAKGKPLVWQIEERFNAIDSEKYIEVSYGLVGKTLHYEKIPITKSKVNEVKSRITAKRKEGYKEITELNDSHVDDYIARFATTNALLEYLNAYLPKYSTTEEGFVLPMLAKVLEDDKPFEKFGVMLGQYKIDGLRCLIGAEKNNMDLFNPVTLTYHSRTGEDWTNKMAWMDDILLPKMNQSLIDMMIEESVYLDGELYLPGYSVNDINSFVKNTTLPQHYKLQYWCYDIACQNMTVNARVELKQEGFKDFNSVCAVFRGKEEHMNNTKQLVLLSDWNIFSFDNAIYWRDKFINLGFEGLIVRNPNIDYQFGKRNQAMFKFKKVDDGKFKIVDIKTEHKRSDLPLFVLRNDINDELFECSINRPQDVQREILINKNDYVGKYMVVEFRNRSGVAAVPFHARGVNIVDA